MVREVPCGVQGALLKALAPLSSSFDQLEAQVP